MKVEDTKIYAVLKEVFLGKPAWEEVYENLKNVVDTNNYGQGFDNEDRLIDCFVWGGNLGDYWADLDDKCLEFKNKQKQKESMKTENSTETNTQTKELELISMDKIYTRNGVKGTVLCINRPFADYNCSTLFMSETGTLYSYDKYGKNNENKTLWLKEYNPWQDVAVDTKVFVILDSCSNKEESRHFSHCKDGRIYVFPDGLTSFTCKYSPIEVKSARLA